MNNNPEEARTLGHLPEFLSSRFIIPCHTVLLSYKQAGDRMNPEKADEQVNALACHNLSYGQS